MLVTRAIIGLLVVLFLVLTIIAGIYARKNRGSAMPISSVAFPVCGLLATILAILFGLTYL
jgi:O-antigen ligase